MAVEIMVLPRVMVGVATKADAQEVLRDGHLHHETLHQAIECVRAMDPEQLKALVVQGLQDADAYPLDFAEVSA
jgi:hypothetical protein